MSIEVLGMFASGTGGDQDGRAVIDIPQDGFILGLDWDAHAFLNADAEFFSAELSFIGTGLLTTNDVRGRISSISTSIHILTSGISTVQINKYVDLKELAVAGGERLFLHVSATAGVVSVFRCNLHFEATGGVMRRSARRR